MPHYRFSEPTDRRSRHRTGHTYPSRWQAIECQQEDGSWVPCGYIEIHLRRVKQDESDVEDISAGITVRINPKREAGR